jgi:hypothetical protein
MRQARSLLYVLVVVTWVLAPTNAHAQQPLVSSTLSRGTIVRIHLRDGELHRGRLVAPFAPDSTALRYCPYPAAPCTLGDPRRTTVPAFNIIGIDRHAGSNGSRGALVGFLAGLGTSLAVHLADGELPNFSDPISTGLTVSSSGIGALIGLMIGGGQHRWVPLTPRAPSDP